ncbi:TetR/AcrR family transcriptional regulator, partial [Escherichia coli]|uniref:TetR/AcrR family transcriptional regulator n=1 Tax=Escherichia coli TaxID=562 RepID=UPI001BDD5F64
MRQACLHLQGDPWNVAGESLMLERMPPPSKRTNDPERTKRDILEVAMAEFASEGYSGARVDAIAARTRTSKRMIYY